MSYQPPPPPGGAPPPPPPQQPGQWGPPPGGGGYGGGPSGSGFDPKTVNPLDWAIMGVGFLVFIFSFVSYYTFSYGPYSISVNAWHGFFGWFGMLLALVGSALVAINLFAPQVNLPLPARVGGLGAYALAAICVILALFVTPGYGDVPDGIDEGHGFGYWASLVLVLAGVVLSLMRVQQTGGKLPGALGSMPNIGARGPQGGISGGQPPQQSYGQAPGQQYGAPPQAPPPAPGPRPGNNPPPPPPPPGYGPPQ